MKMEASRQMLKQMLAEFMGTFILMSFGLGSVVQYYVSEGTTGTIEQIRWAWGLAVAFGTYTAGGTSGGHLNPAVTLGLCVTNKCPWKRLIPFWTGQYLGAFTASCAVYLVYYDALAAYEGGRRTIESAAMFSTYPQAYLSVWNGIADQTFSTSLLMFVVMALCDQDNMGPGKGYFPLMAGLIVTAIGMTFGHNCGYAINPARDFPPRLFSYLAGWGTKVFSYNDYKWFWIPVLGPYLGAVLGACCYMAFIKLKFPFEGIYMPKGNRTITADSLNGKECALNPSQQTETKI